MIGIRSNGGGDVLENNGTLSGGKGISLTSIVGLESIDNLGAIIGQSLASIASIRPPGSPS